MSNFLWLGWFIFLVWHPILAIIILPVFVAFYRGHRHPFLVLILTVLFGWTPSWLLIMLYATERPDQPYRITRRHRRRI